MLFHCDHRLGELGNCFDEAACGGRFAAGRRRGEIGEIIAGCEAIAFGAEQHDPD
jgi:hypothetical protein